MSGIDQSHQILLYHAVLRKMLVQKNAGVHLLEFFLTNVYLYRKFAVINKDVSHLVEFWEVIIDVLIGQQKMKVTQGPTSNFHYLDSISNNEKKKN